jgi:predicted CXXCH cytochrome family protein
MYRRGICVVVLACAIALAWSACAFAFDETTSTIFVAPDGCADCHVPNSTTTSSGTRFGPHGDYLTTTNRCVACHTVHAAPIGGEKLLPGQTIKDTCLTCHDGTSAFGEGVYGAIEARMGAGAVKSGHSVDTTSVVPGGNAATGGSRTASFTGENGYMTCSDCHSPHGSNCVTPFLGERQRSWQFYDNYHGELTVQVQNRLLKQKPGDSTVAVADYGSDWCAGCHAGRPSGLAAVHNHPVETDASQAGTLYTYRSLGIISVGPYPTSETTVGPAGINTKPDGFNRAYLMPYPRTGAQLGHNPICQQCHEDARDVGSLSADGTQATPSAAIVTQPDGRVATDNPRFQNFPHESTNDFLLVETADNLCLNCHPPAALP